MSSPGGSPHEGRPPLSAPTERRDHRHPHLAEGAGATPATSILSDIAGLPVTALGPYRTKAELAAETLRRAIAGGTLKRGERLRFAHLVNALSMSVTPIREALLVLEAEGLVSMESHREIRVAGFTVADIEEIYRIRSTLECMAVEEAAMRLSAEDLEGLHSLIAQMEEVAESNPAALPEMNAAWHQWIYAAGSSKYLHFLIKRLWVAFPWDTLWAIPNRARTSIEEHREIMDAIVEREAKRAGRLVRKHILGSERPVIAYLNATQSEVTPRATGAPRWGTIDTA